MILYVEKNPCHWIPMACDDTTLWSQNAPHAKNLGWKLFYDSNIDFGHPLWTFLLNRPILWDVVQLKLYFGK
jgi:hypothetical protein